jgi:hypothetical protein
MTHFTDNCTGSCTLCKAEFKVYDKYQGDKTKTAQVDRLFQRRRYDMCTAARTLRRLQKRLQMLLDIKVVRANLPRVVAHGVVPLLPSCVEGIEDLVLQAWKLQVEVRYARERFLKVKQNYYECLSKH